MPNVTITSQPSTIVKVTNQNNARIKSTYSNPDKQFRVQDASDVAISNPSNGQVIIWDSNLNKFTVSPVVSINTASQAFLIANQALTIANIANSTATNANNQATLSLVSIGQKGNVFQTIYISGLGLTVNSGTSLTTFGNSTVTIAANAASVGGVGVVQLNDTTFSTSTTQAATANVVGSLNTQLTTVSVTSQQAFDTANTANSVAQLGIIQANNALAQVSGAYAEANTAYLLSGFSRNSPASFYDANGIIQIVGPNVARSGFDPTTLLPLGFISESQATNLVGPSIPISPIWTNAAALDVSNSVIAPDGTLTGVSLTELSTTSTHSTGTPQTIAFVANTIYTFSVYLKQNTASIAQLWTAAPAFSVGEFVNFDLNNGIVASANNNPIAADIQKIPNGWYRCWMSVVATATVNQSVSVGLTNNTVRGRNPIYLGTGAGIYVWGAQIETGVGPPSSYITTSTANTFTRLADTSINATVISTQNIAQSAFLVANTALNSTTAAFPVANSGLATAQSASLVIGYSRASPASYYDLNGTIQIAANNIARNDYNPTTLVANGVLLEAQANNFAFPSVPTSAWTKTGSTLTLTSTTAPDGSGNGVLFLDTVATSTHSVAPNNISFIANSIYTFSIYAKSNTANVIQLWLAAGPFSGGQFVNFDVGNGIIASANNSPVNFGIQSIPNGWYRCWMSVSATANNTAAFNLGLTNNTVAGRNFNYLGTGKGVYIWGSQVELGSGPPTSYIPSTVVGTFRAPDVSAIQNIKILTQAAFDTANAINTFAGSGFSIANSALNLSQSAFNRANSSGAGGGQQTFITANGITVNTGTILIVSGNNTVIVSANLGNTTQVGVVQLNDTFTSNSNSQATTANVANTIWTNQQASFALVNSTTNLVTSVFAEANGFQSVINSAFLLANSTTNLVTGAYALANSDANLVASAFAEANGFQSVINSAFSLTNSTTNLVTSAYGRANAAVQNQQTFLTSNGITVNAATSLIVSGNNTVLLSINVGNTTQAGLVQLNDTFTSTFVNQAATTNVANTIWTTTTGSFQQANNVYNITGFQRLTPASYVDSTGTIQYAVANVARVTYDPTTLLPLGVLYEQAANNSVPFSVPTAGWQFTGTGDTEFLANTAAPDGTLTGASFNETITTAAHSCGPPTFTFVAGNIYTVSFFIKKNTANIAQIFTNSGPFGNAEAVNFDLTTGAAAVTAVIRTPIGYGTIAYPNGWFRCWMTVPCTSTSSGSFFAALVNNNFAAARNLSYLGTGAGIYVWGAQAEVGFGPPTSFIKTNAANGFIRAADVSYIGALNNIIDPSNNVIILGNTANSYGVGSKVTYANGMFANAGDVQFSSTLLRMQTTASANTYNLSTTGANVTSNVYGSINQLHMSNNSLFAFTAMVAARDANNNSKIWETKGGIKTTVGATGTIPIANTTIIGTPVINIIAADNGTNAWTIILATDLANNALLFKATGSTNTTNWVAKVDTVEVA